jgi:hypothetical protein
MCFHIQLVPLHLGGALTKKPVKIAVIIIFAAIAGGGFAVGL